MVHFVNINHTKNLLEADPENFWYQTSFVHFVQNADTKIYSKKTFEIFFEILNDAVHFVHIDHS